MACRSFGAANSSAGNQSDNASISQSQRAGKQDPVVDSVEPSDIGISTNHLREYLLTCNDLLGTVTRENTALQHQQEYHPDESVSARKSLLPRLDIAYKTLKQVRLIWQQSDQSEREQNVELSSLFRQLQDFIMKILILDKENEQLLLWCGLVPPALLPSVQQRPHFVTDLYQRISNR